MRLSQCDSLCLSATVGHVVGVVWSAGRSDTVTVNYEGRVAETSHVFDSSLARGAAVALPAAGLISGWAEGHGHPTPATLSLHCGHTTVI